MLKSRNLKFQLATIKSPIRMKISLARKELTNEEIN